YTSSSWQVPIQFYDCAVDGGNPRIRTCKIDDPDPEVCYEIVLTSHAECCDGCGTCDDSKTTHFNSECCCFGGCTDGEPDCSNFPETISVTLEAVDYPGPTAGFQSHPSTCTAAADWCATLEGTFILTQEEVD